MPEGDTIFRAATSLRRWLGGREITGASLPRLVGRTVEAVDAHGKHLLMRFSGDLVLHTHMRMTGSWHVYPKGERWQKSPRAARVVLESGDRVAVCFAAPVAELLTAAQVARHPALSKLGPDVLVPSSLEPSVVVARARASSVPTAGELLLDQRVVAGIGNIFRCESLFLCGVHPRRPAASLTAEGILELVTTASQLMQPSAHGPTAGRSFDGVTEEPWVYKRVGRPCRRCGTTICRELLGTQARAVYWCPGCQPD